LWFILDEYATSEHAGGGAARHNHQRHRGSAACGTLNVQEECDALLRTHVTVRFNRAHGRTGNTANLTWGQMAFTNK